jgi:hypothetical protein
LAERDYNYFASAVNGSGVGAMTEVRKVTIGTTTPPSNGGPGPGGPGSGGPGSGGPGSGGPGPGPTGGPGIIETIDEDERVDICLIGLESLREHVKQRGNVDYDSDELEKLTLEIKEETEVPITIEEVSYVLENFEEECDSYIPLFGGLILGRYRNLSTIVFVSSTILIILFLIFLYLASRRIKKIKEKSK